MKPIYQTEGRFVICILGPEYPKRIWTNFESQAFKDRFKDGDVIPIWLSTAEPSAFDMTRTIGALSYDVERDLKSQIEGIADTLSKKLEEARHYELPFTELIAPEDGAGSWR